MNTFSIDLDLDKQGPLQVVRVRQGDKNGTTIAATIYDHGQPLTGSFNTRVVLATPGGETYYRKVGTFANGVATVTIDETGAATISGQSFGYFQLLQGTTVIASTESFVLQVLPDALADASVAEPYDEAIQQAIEELQEATANIPENVRNEVDAQLAAHPEWTTTVQDGSITYPKLASSLKQRLNNKLHRLVTAPVVTASDAYAAPPVALVVDGKSVQDGTPTPDAPVAIQSVKSVGFAAHGANMAALPYANNRDAGATGTLANGVTWTVNADGSITLDGTATAKGGLDVLSQGWSHAGKVTRGMAYTFSCDSNLVRCKAWAQGSGSDRFAYGSIMQTIPLTGNWNFGINIPSGTVLSNVVVRPQLECGRHVHEWAPPTTPSLTPIPLQGHALRSLPDGTKDELRVDADGNVTLVQRVGSVTLDGSSDEGWRYSSSSSYSDPTNGKYCYFTEPIFDANIRKGTTLFTSSMASHYRFVTLSTLQSNKEQGTCTFSAQDTHPSFTIITPHTALSDMTTWLASNPVTVDYPLATPVEIQLGTVALPSMPAPDLTAWASCTPATDIELDYERDVNIALAAAESVAATSLAPADGPTATASHAAGSLLTLGGQLVKATRAIVAGEQIAIGTNVAVTTVAAELAALA